jgi:hypothetical protein
MGSDLQWPDLLRSVDAELWQLRDADAELHERQLVRLVRLRGTGRVRTLDEPGLRCESKRQSDLQRRLRLGRVRLALRTADASLRELRHPDTGLWRRRHARRVDRLQRRGRLLRRCDPDVWRGSFANLLGDVYLGRVRLPTRPDIVHRELCRPRQ